VQNALLVHVGGGLLRQLAATRVLAVLDVGGVAALDLFWLLELPQPAARIAVMPNTTAMSRVPKPLTRASLVRFR
jgi:hypothetical protein